MDIEVLRQWLAYDPDTGHFSAKGTAHAGRWKSDRRVGTPIGKGYLMARIQKKAVLLHRAAFAIMTGQWPTGHIDHINGDKADNRWCNLREVTNMQNHWNIAPNANGTHISHNNSKPYRAQITHAGKRYHLGYFATREEAERAYAEASAQLRGDFSSRLHLGSG